MAATLQQRRRKASDTAAVAAAAASKQRSARVRQGCGRSLAASIVLALLVACVAVAAIALTKPHLLQHALQLLQLLPPDTTPRYAFSVPHTFTKQELAEYDGSEPSKPILLSILGRVYDVSASPEYYGKDGGYSWFAGRDASLSFIDGCFNAKCFDESKTVETFSENQLNSIAEWADFYEKEDKYIFVGYLEGALPPRKATE